MPDASAVAPVPMPFAAAPSAEQVVIVSFLALHPGAVADVALGVLRDDVALRQPKRVTHCREVPAAHRCRLPIGGFPYGMVFLLTAMQADAIGQAGEVGSSSLGRSKRGMRRLP